jgi:hypothetical protein
MKKIIHKCENGHYFINNEKCPLCGGIIESNIDYLQGDCIACGQLCSENTYCCNSPRPIDEKSFI